MIGFTKKNLMSVKNLSNGNSEREGKRLSRNQKL